MKSVLVVSMEMAVPQNVSVSQRELDHVIMLTGHVTALKSGWGICVT